MSDTTHTATRPAHAIDSDGAVMIGAAAGLDDLLTAMRAAAVGNRVVRLFDVDTLDDMARPAALAEGYGWQPTFRLRFPQGRSVDMHLGGGL